MRIKNIDGDTYDSADPCDLVQGGQGHDAGESLELFRICWWLTRFVLCCIGAAWVVMYVVNHVQ